MKKAVMACAALLAVCSAVPVLEATGIVATYNATTQKITMIDTVNGAVIISPTNAMKVYDTSWDFHTGETPITPTSITFTPQTDGYDIEVLLVNNQSTPQRVGTIWVSGITFDTTSYYRNFDYFAHGDGEGTATQNMYGNWFPGGPTYPGGCYSPVDVVRGTVAVPPPIVEGPGGGGSFTGGGGKSKSSGSKSGTSDDKTPIDDEEIPVEPARAEYAIGVSLLYPVLDYNVSVQKEYQAVGGTWQVGFYINPKYNASGGIGSEYNSAGDIPPYDSAHPNANRRTYKVSVRVLRNPSSYPVVPAEWLRTLEPYREYFQKTYGAPRYEPDYRPIEGISMAAMEACGSSNQHGFSSLRPDINGWGSTVSDLATQRGYGWSRQLLWAPSGVNCPLPATNYRYEFTSEWNNLSAMSGSQNILTGYAFSNLADGGVGLWWGRSTETMGGWGSSSYTLMDQRNTTTRGRAFQELDGARAVSARDIGLDQYILRRREGFAWLQEMRLRYPELRFCGEAVQSDIIHLQSANYELVGYNPQATDHSTCSPARPLIRPLALADFLLHRHETWAASWVSWININNCESSADTWNLHTAIMEYWPEYVAGQGYTPLINLWSTADAVVDTVAATGSPSYTITVPSDLRTPYCPQITAQPPTTVASGCSTDITLHATAVSPRSLTLSYQWYFRPESLDPANDTLPTDLVNGMMHPCNDTDKWGNETTDTLTVHVQPKTFGTYALLVTEPGGGPTWTAFTRVYSMGDIDRNGVIDTDDYTLFSALFTASYADPRADVNHDGVIDYYDYLDFVDAYSTGC